MAHASNQTPVLALTFQTPVVLTTSAGDALEGNLLLFAPLNATGRVDTLSSVTLGVRAFSGFTITSEASTEEPPALSIVIQTNTVRLSWPNQNQPFILQSAASIEGVFTTVTDDVSFGDGNFSVTLPFGAGVSSRFFRLRLAGG